MTKPTDPLAMTLSALEPFERAVSLAASQNRLSQDDWSAIRGAFDTQHFRRASEAAAALRELMERREKGVEELVRRLDGLSEFYRYRPVSRDEVPALEEMTKRECEALFKALDEAARMLSATAILALDQPRGEQQSDRLCDEVSEKYPNILQRLHEGELSDRADYSTVVSSSQPGASGAAAQAPYEAAVHRVCHLITGGCERCPSSFVDEDRDVCVKGCYASAQEIVNTVETGNPWRKTEGVKAPWVVLNRSASPTTEGDREEVDVIRYARGLAVSLNQRFYPAAPEFKPLDTLSGLLSQIDNMISGLRAVTTAQRLGEHWLWQMVCDHEEKTDIAICSCGLWKSGAMASIGDAATAWAEHALESC